MQAVTQSSPSITRVIAGPGSGKTRILTCRIAYLLLKTSRSDRVLGVTFTRKAAAEMQERVAVLLDAVVAQNDEGILAVNASSGAKSTDADELRDKRTQAMLNRVTLGTFHSVCAKILRWNGDLLATLPSLTRDMPQGVNLDGSFAVIDEASQLRILKDCLKEMEIDLELYKLKTKPLLATLADCRSKIVAGIDPFQIQGNKPFPKILEIAQRVRPQYQNKLIGHNCLDFDDLIYYTLELLQVHRDVRERLQRLWSHILVDEFQDTSRSQMDIVRLLTTDSLFVVGDADQSIYSWRGAHVDSILDFEDAYRDSPGGVHTVYLMENYRSTANIVKAAQKVISHVPQKSSSSKTGDSRKNMKPKREPGALPRIVAMDDDGKEAEFVVKTIQDALAAGKYDHETTTAVLYRTNAQSRALEEACVRASLPYVIVGSTTSFYKRQEIKDCLCFLRWIHNGRDRVAMLRAMETPKRGIGDRAIQEFDTYCAEVEAYYDEHHAGVQAPNPLDILFSFTGGKDTALCTGLSPPTGTISKRPFNLFKELSYKMRRIYLMAESETLETVLATVIEEFALIPHIDKISNSVSEFEERQANVRELQQTTSRYTGPCLIERNSTDSEFIESPLGTFLDDVALVTETSDSKEPSEERFVVKLMTIHTSKGTEFDVVFVVGNEDGTFPTSQAIQEGEGSVVLAEENRLCYVAMTRAKSELIMTWRKNVAVFTSVGVRSVQREMSRFLKVLVNKKETKENKTATTAGSTEESGHSDSNRQVSLGEPSWPNYQSKRKYSAAAFNKKGSASLYAQRRREILFKPSPDQGRFEGTNAVYKSRSSQRPPATEISMKRSMIGATRVPNVVAHLPSTGQPFPPDVHSSTRQGRNVSSHDAKASAFIRYPEKVASPDHSDRSNTTKFPHSAVEGAPQHWKKAESLSSTVFYPVGSAVLHASFGQGTVLPPLPTGDPMTVRIEFGNGQRREFDAAGDELSPC